MCLFGIVVKSYLDVVEEFDPARNYELKIRPQYVRCLSILKKGDRINLKEFIESHLNEFTNGIKSFKTNREAIAHSFWIGRKIGILRPVPQQEVMAISFDEFCKLETISYFLDQLRDSHVKNLAAKNNGTKYTYSHRLWKFNEWLHGKSFEFHRAVHLKGDTFKRVTETITLEGVEHLLKLYQEPFKVESEFVKVVKKYLLDQMHEGKRATTMKIDYNAIKSYFEKNDSPLNFRFNYNAKYKSVNGEDEQPSLSLDDVMNLLTVGKPTLTQKAVFLCKLHRGLDTLTLLDRFNFQVWPQLVEYFETSDYHSWNLKKCPVPIKLTRIKTDYTHTGFLERDAVEAIQKYLDYRRHNIMRDMKNGEALFLTAKNKPITKEWVNYSLRKLAQNAGLEKKLAGYLGTKYRINSHEFRDLLKSTLLDCGVRQDVAEHCIGHMPRDSYEKQATLYPESLRMEYSKASKRLNVFSNFSSFVKGGADYQQMQTELIKLREDIEMMKQHREISQKYQQLA